MVVMSEEVAGHASHETICFRQNNGMYLAMGLVADCGCVVSFARLRICMDLYDPGQNMFHAVALICFEVL